jgi:hypothetical protein
MKHDMPAYAMIDTGSIDGPLLASVLSAIGDADAAALRHFDHSRTGGDPDACARAAGSADERANRARSLARTMIERAGL